MAYTLNDIFKEIYAQKTLILSKGGQVEYQSPNPSLKDITKGIESIPTLLLQGGTYSIRCTETANTTFTLKLDEAVIDTKTNDATIGGSVIFTPTAVGNYTVVATQNGAEKWTKTIGVQQVGEMVCKSPIPVRNYTEDERDLAAKNHYAKYMFELLDYVDDPSFVGSTSATYIRRFIVGFDEMELSDGTGLAGITWHYRATPSEYKMHTSNDNSVSWEGCDMRATRCLPANSDYYICDKTVTDTTVGTYYSYDYTINNFVERTLPDEYVATEDYYVKNTTTEDGTIYAGIVESFRKNLVKVKVKTWRGWTKQITSDDVAQQDDKYIISHDYVFLPSGVEDYGERPEISSQNYWGYKPDEGKPFGFQSLNKKWYNIYASVTTWLRSPYVYRSSYFCFWSNSYINVNSTNATSANSRPTVCVCQ